jgi:heme exporter protein CcmD
MTGLGRFLEMGGYGFYVWSAYGVGLVILGLVWSEGARRRRRVERALADTGQPRDAR